MADLATLASSNFPTGTEAIGNNLDNYLRSHAAIVRSTNAVASATIASASTVDIASADGEFVSVTGSSTINSLGTGFPGCRREIRFSGSLTIVNSSGILLPGGVNYAVVPGDVLAFRCISAGVWVLSPGGRYMGGDAISSTGYWLSASTAAVVAASGSGSVFLRPNGRDAATGEVSINSAGRMTTSALVLSNGSDAGFLAQDRTSGRQWTMYGTGDSWRVNAGSIGDRLTLDTAGNLTVTGNITSTSDEGFKTGWEVLPSDLIERLAAVKFGTYERTDTGERQAGVSAQSLRKALPEVVSADPDGKLSVAYGNAALVGLIALSRRVLELEKAGRG
jgi:hypothetical protein